MTRPDWDGYFFRLAALVATRATCPRAQIGAVLTKQNLVIGSGYNGVPSGREHCPDTAEHLALDHCRDAVHAEYNALANALVPAFGATLYVVGARKVCPDCADRLRENGVRDIRHRDTVPTLDGVAAEVVAWQRQTFWAPSLDDVPSTIEHIRREVLELAADPSNELEVADVLILLLRLADNLGMDLTAAVARKLDINRRRVWQAPDANGVTEHVREVAV
jgi:dCMP deaminase